MGLMRALFGTRQRRSAVRAGQAMPEEGEAARGAAWWSQVRWQRAPALILLVGALWMLWTLFGAERFRVAGAEVEGTRLLSEAEVQRLIGVSGRSLLAVRPAEIEERLLAEFPVLADAQVVCRLPDQVVVRLVEREAALVWESGGRLWWVDVEGGVLGETADAGELPVVRDVEAMAPQPGRYVVGVPWRLALEMRAALPGIRAFDYRKDYGLVLHVTVGQWPVYLGHKGDAQAKAAVMWALVETLTAQSREAEYLDLRNEQRPTVKLR